MSEGGNLHQRARFTWQLRSRTLPLGDRTLLMAIVNLTPDSFSGDGLLAEESEGGVEAALQAAISSVDGGADIVDLGAESTRPNATPLPAEVEQQRLLPVLEALLRERPAAVVSVDTYHASTARAAVLAGAEIINDVSGLLWDPEMGSTLAQLRPGVVLMHTRGRPTDWRMLPALAPGSVGNLVQSGWKDRLGHARAAGIRADAIVLDPGFGFGKRGRENFELLAGLPELAAAGKPLLVGLSRKGFLGEAAATVQGGLQLPAADKQAARYTASIAAHTAAILGGAHILRVHDLQAAREAAAVSDALLLANAAKTTKTAS